MGGEGTWSLAAADPQRWAAIVPLCGGGDPKTAGRISQIPCWCFHGEADRMIPPILSQKMVEAIRKAGGNPLYQLYPGVDHNCWDRTYARDDLYEWMLEQKQGEH
jgi:predicted peptidase